MKLVLAFLSVVLAIPVWAAGEVEEGDQVPNMCWQDSTDKEVCLYDGKEKVAVVIYSAPSCTACAEAMPQIVARAQALAGQPVVFYNLVSQGEKDGDAPSTAILQSWKTRFNIPFTVAGSPQDAGSVFFFQAKAPVVAVVGKTKDRELKYSAEAINVDELFTKIAAAIAEPIPPPPL